MLVKGTHQLVTHEGLPSSSPGEGLPSSSPGEGVCIAQPRHTTSIFKKIILISRKTIHISGKVVNVVGKFFSGVCGVRQLIGPVNQVKKLTKELKIIDIAFVPFHFLNVIYSINKLVRGDPSERIDVVLETLNEAGAIKNNVNTFYNGLQIAGVKYLFLSRLSITLSMLSLAFNLSSLISRVRNLSKMKLIQKQIIECAHLKKDSTRVSVEDFQATISFIENQQKKDGTFCSKIFNWNSEKLLKRISEIAQQAIVKTNSLDPDDVAAGEEELFHTLKALEKRVQSNVHSTTISAVCAVAVVLGAVALFSPAAKVVSLVLSTINIAQFACQKFSQYSFAHSMNLKRKWYEWIFC